MIHVLHGFLGSPNDFFFLKDLNFMTPLGGVSSLVFHDLYQDDSFPTPQPDDIFIGYSLGGRIALDLCSRVDFNIKKLILIGSHIGYDPKKDKAQKQDRIKTESMILSQLENRSFKDFMVWWNNLSLFKYDQPLETELFRFQKSPILFRKYLLSKQKYYLPELKKYREKIVFIAGEMDFKFINLINEKLNPHNIKNCILKKGGHRLFQHQEELGVLLQQEIN